MKPATSPLRSDSSGQIPRATEATSTTRATGRALRQRTAGGAPGCADSSMGGSLAEDGCLALGLSAAHPDGRWQDRPP